VPFVAAIPLQTRAPFVTPMETPKPQAGTGWIHLALFVLGPLFAVVFVAYFTVSPSPKRYRAAADPVCLQLLEQRKQVQTQVRAGARSICSTSTIS